MLNLFKEDFASARGALRPLRSIIDELRAALTAPDQFSIRYQPVVEGNTKSVVLAEALLRWTSPVLGEVLPGRFIQIAESNGLIRDVTRMVLRKVCQDMARLNDLVITVNVSRTDISDPAFPAEVAKIVAEFGVSPKRLVLECTDSMTPEDAQKSEAVQQALREQGHAVATYEMETGFTSFGFLKMHGFTLLKVHRVLLDEALQNDVSRQNLKDAIEDSRSKGIKSLAFGVETKAQAKLVKSMGFDFQQGFYHSPSLAFDEIVDFANMSALSDA